MIQEKEIKKIVSEEYILENCNLVSPFTDENIQQVEADFLEYIPYNISEKYITLKQLLLEKYKNELKKHFKLGLKKGIKIIIEILSEQN